MFPVVCVCLSVCHSVCSIPIKLLVLRMDHLPPSSTGHVHYVVRSVGKRTIGIQRKKYLLVTVRKRSLRRLCFYRCLSFCPQGGACVVARRGGVRGCSGGCVVAWGVCMVAPWGGMHGCSGGVCVVVFGGRACFFR